MSAQETTWNHYSTECGSAWLTYGPPEPKEWDHIIRDRGLEHRCKGKTVVMGHKVKTK